MKLNKKMKMIQWNSMTYEIFVTSEIKIFFSYINTKSAWIIKQHLKKLKEYQYPGKWLRDKEKSCFFQEQININWNGISIKNIF